MNMVMRFLNRYILVICFAIFNKEIKQVSIDLALYKYKDQDYINSNIYYGNLIIDLK